MKIIVGNADVVEQLEVALAEAKAGTLVGVVICGISPGDGIIDGGHGWTGAVREDAVFPFARLYASVAAAYHDLGDNGMVDWK